ncbi:MAG: hypothetical protein HY271_00805, partial [Deltaproteobacteria bacterium]|nr:hypothetical protein [Deltaproteobacteria bacterium]
MTYHRIWSTSPAITLAAAGLLVLGATAPAWATVHVKKSLTPTGKNPAAQGKVGLVVKPHSKGKLKV